MKQFFEFFDIKMNNIYYKLILNTFLIDIKMIVVKKYLKKQKKLHF